MARPRKLSRLAKIERLTASLSPFERLLLYILTALLSMSALALLSLTNAAVSVTVPSSGGALVEGQLGPARFINPLIPMSQADADIAALVYSGLTRALPDGTVIPDLASSYEISPDGTSYTFKIRENATFHDGIPVTAADVMFTVQKAQNSDIKSVHRADWEGVSISTPDANTVIFKLPRAYAPFIQNTTMGILPAHLWSDVSAEEFPFSPLNTKPLGSGPFKVAKVSTSASGSISRYELEPFKAFVLGKPYLRRITFVFYPNDAAMLQGLNAGEIDSIAGISAGSIEEIKRKDVVVHAIPLPRIFGVFFNQGHASVLANQSVRSALDVAVVKERVVQMILNGYGFAVDSPAPPHILTRNSTNERAAGFATADTSYTDDSIESAKELLRKGGWSFSEETATWTNSKKEELRFTLATADTPELVATANAVLAAWQALGVQVSVKVYPISELNTNVIRPREYDAILFGEIVGRELDLFAFWHSSQRNDPGLNLSLYTNARADTLLSQARTATNAQERQSLYEQFVEIVQEDIPAVFLYSPEFLYATPQNLRGVTLGSLTAPAERFITSYQWYTDTEKVWSIFTNKAQETL